MTASAHEKPRPRGVKKPRATESSKAWVLTEKGRKLKDAAIATAGAFALAATLGGLWAHAHISDHNLLEPGSMSQEQNPIYNVSPSAETTTYTTIDGDNWGKIASSLLERTAIPEDANYTSILYMTTKVLITMNPSTENTLPSGYTVILPTSIAILR